MKQSIHRFWASVGVGAGIFIVAADWSIVQNALPVLQRSLGASIGELQWIMNAFSIFTVGFLVVMGRVGDIVGRRKIYVLGVLVFTAASLGAALSTNALALIMARACQGLGFAMIMPMGQALIVHIYPEEEHGKAMGIWGLLAGLGIVFGPIIGGLIVSFFAWQWIFYINIPVAAFVLVLVALFVEESRNQESPPHLDIKGAVCFTIGVGALIFTIVQAPDWGFGLPVGLASAVALAAFTVFYFLEQKAQTPLIQFDFFKNHRFFGGAIGIFTACFLSWTSFFLVPLYFQIYRHDPPWISGLALVAIGVAYSLFAQIGGKLSDKIDKRKIIFVGFILMFLELISFTISIEVIPFAVIVFLLFIFGTGMSLAWIPSNSLGISALPRGYAGIASGAIATIQETGGAVGLAITGSVLRVAEKYRFAALAESGGVRLPEPVAREAKTLLSNPKQWYAFLSAKVSYSYDQLSDLFTHSFLFGLRSALYLAIALTLLVMIVLIVLFTRDRERKSPAKKKSV
ncbi:MAG: MFS transporter [Chlamydiota bacterium]